MPPPPRVPFGVKAVSFRLNSAMLFEFRPLEPTGILVQAVIGPCPEKKREERFMHCMHANFLAQGTGGAAIGLDHNEQTLSLSLKLRHELTYTSFKEHLEVFANYLEYWRANISEY